MGYTARLGRRPSPGPACPRAGAPGYHLRGHPASGRPAPPGGRAGQGPRPRTWRSWCGKTLGFWGPLPPACLQSQRHLRGPCVLPSPPGLSCEGQTHRGQHWSAPCRSKVRVSMEPLDAAPSSSVPAGPLVTPQLLLSAVWVGFFFPLVICVFLVSYVISIMSVLGVWAQEAGNKLAPARTFYFPSA